MEAPPPPSFYHVFTSRHHLPLCYVAQGRPITGVDKGFISLGFIVAPLEAHAGHQNSCMLHVQLEFRYQGDM